jgi:WD40 repeat protein/tRNA A-37 threonylcarbamoyl transferase component Bud32
MNAEHFRRISEAFDELVSRPAQERQAAIHRRFPDEPALRHELEALLAEHDRLDAPVATAGGLEAAGRSVAALGVVPVRGSTPDELLPVLKGAYRLLHVIGEGGMGVVYEAEQAFPRRRVALKSIRPGLASASMLRRFKTEIELLARLDHPGIAQVYEAGYADERSPDQAFLVMELVAGSPLTRYASDRSLSLGQRLELFLKVCDAVQHAHQRGVIHRDLKPANIYVTSEGVPKVLDFGVARAADDAGDRTMATHAGQVIGTPSYMSPEQFSGEPVDTRTDVYALGVIAYELLTGELPFDFSKVPLSDAARIIRDQASPRLSRSDRSLRGDLDVIVSQAMHPDRERRYATAAALADDVRRFLDHQPISARRDSGLYVLGKFARRHSFLVAMSAVVLIALAAFGVFSSVMAVRNKQLALDATLAKKNAEEESTRATALSRTLSEELIHARVDRGRAEAAAGKLKLAEDTLWTEYVGNPGLSTARWALSETYHKMPCHWTVQGEVDTTVAAVSKDGRFIVLGTAAGVIAVRRAEDGREHFKTEAMGAALTSVAVSASGDWIAFGLSDGRAGLLATTGASTPEFLSCDEGSVLHARGVLAVSFSGDDKVLAFGGNDKRISLWDVRKRERTDVWTAHPEATICIAANRTGTVIASAARSVLGGRSVWRKESGQWVSEEIPSRPNDHLSWMRFDGDDTLLFAFSGSQIDRLNVETMQLSLFSQGIGGRVLAGASSPDGTQYVFGAAQTPFVCVSDSSATARSLGQQLSTVIAVGWVGPTRVVTVNASGELRSFDVRPEIALHRITGFASWCFSAAWSSDGSMLALDGGGASISTYRTKTFDALSTAPMPFPRLRTRAMRFFKGSSTVACAGVDGQIRLVDATTGTITRTIGPARAEMYSLLILPDQETVLTGHADGVIRVWDITSDQVRRELPKQARRIEGMALSPDGALLASSGLVDGVQLWDVATWDPVGTLATTAQPWGVAISPDGSTLFATTYAGTLEVFDLPTRSLRKVIAAHQRLAPGLAVSPDGALVATSSEDGSVRLWDATSLRQLTVFDLNVSELVHLTFDPTSRYLAVSAAWRQTIVIDLHAMDPFIEGNRAYQEARLRAEQEPAE